MMRGVKIRASLNRNHSLFKTFINSGVFEIARKCQVLYLKGIVQRKKIPKTKKYNGAKAGWQEIKVD